MKKIRVDKDGWCRCGGCGHKLFSIKDPGSEALLRMVVVEIKCHSCKEINRFDDENNENN